MRRIKLSRPPPVSSETVSDNAAADSRIKKTEDFLFENQSGDVSAVSADTSVDVRLTTRKNVDAVEEDTQRLKHKRCIEQDEHKHSTAASKDVVQSSSSTLVNSTDFLPVKEPKKKHQHRDVSRTSAAVESVDTFSSYDGQHVVSADNVVHRSATGRGHHSSKKSNKTAFVKSRSGHAESTFLGPAYDIHVSSEQNSDGPFHEKSVSAPPSHDTVTHAERQQSKLETDSKLSGTLLDEALKGFLVQKLAAIENERKGTDDVSVKEVPHNKSKDFSPPSKLKRHKHSRKSDEQRGDLEYLLAKSRDRDKKLAAVESAREVSAVNSEDAKTEEILQTKLKDFSSSSKLRRSKHSRESDEQWRNLEYLPAKSPSIDEKLAAIASESTGTGVKSKDIGVKDVVQNGSKDFSPSAELRGRKHSRSSDEQRRYLEPFPAKSRDRDPTFYHRAEEFRENRYMPDYAESLIADWPYGHRRLPPYSMHGFSGAADKSMDTFGTEVNSHGRDHRRRSHDLRHSLHMRRNLQHSQDRNPPKEYRHQSYDLLMHEANQIREHRSFDGIEQEQQPKEYRHQWYDFLQRQGNQDREQTQRSFDCIEQVRQFVSRNASQFSHSINEDHGPVEPYLENRDSKPRSRERHKSGSSHSHHSHHHIKKRKSLNQTSADIEQVQPFISHTPAQFSHLPVEHYPENTDSEILSRERQRSGSSHSHQHHHHVKKRKSLKHTSTDKTSASRHKCVKHGSGTKSMQIAVKSAQQEKKHRKHKHRRHSSKNISKDGQSDSEKLDRSDTEVNAEDDSFSRARSLSPLGLDSKHRRKQKRKKSSEKTVSETSSQNAPLPEKVDTQYDQISEDEDFVPMKVQKNDDDGNAATLKEQHKTDMANTTDVKHGQTSGKSVVKPKFLKISGKRPKRRTHISNNSQSAEVEVPSEHVGNSDVSVEEHSDQNTSNDESQVLNDTGDDLATTEETSTPIVDAAKNNTDEVEISVPVDSVVSEPANSCKDTDDRGVLQTKAVADQVSQPEVSNEMLILSADEVSTAPEKSTAAAIMTESMTESFRAEISHHLGANEQQNIMNATNDMPKELSTQEKIIPFSNAANVQEHTTDEAYDSNCSETTEDYDVCEYDADVDLHGVPTVGEDKNAEKTKSEELEAVVQEVLNVAYQSTVSDDSVTPAFTAPQSLNISKEAVPDVSSGEGTSGDGSGIVKTMNMAESICEIDDEVCENFLPVPGSLMGPPVGLPPVAASFKKPLPAMKLNVLITDTSADIISSGTRNVRAVRRPQTEENREEGELSESDEGEDSSDDDNDDDGTESTVTAHTDVSLSDSIKSTPELDSSGSLTDSDVEPSKDETTQEMPAVVGKVKKGGKSKKVCKKHRKHKKEKGADGKKKSGDKKLKTKLKTAKSKISSRTARAFSRSRSRSYSVMRTFDEKRGVWRTRKPQDIIARQLAQCRLRACSDLRIQIDKTRLREIALKNAYKNMRSGHGPKLKARMSEISKVIYGQKSVEELTDMCRTMARTGDRSSDSDSDAEVAGSRWRRPPPSDDECDDAVVLKSHQLRSYQRDSNIVLNIRNARQVPVVSKEELRAQAAVLRLNFPVSSGQQHRAQETGWQLVTTGSATGTTSTTTDAVPEEREPMRGVNVKNIGQVVTERLNALRRLTVNPEDSDAMNAAYSAQQKLQQWAESKRTPGSLPPTVKLRMPKPLVPATATGTQPAAEDGQQVEAISSEAGTASVSEELASLTTTTTPSQTSHTTLSPAHIGRLLLQKMGWKDGEGLGKDNAGPTAPLQLDMKKDRKGLAWVDPELFRMRPPRPILETPAYPDLAAMPPVAALLEFCFRRRLMNPVYELIENDGPAHRKTFKYKVIVDGMEYQPIVASGSKKSARVEAAIACLHDMTAIPPSSEPLPPQSFGVPPMPALNGAPRPAPCPRAPVPRPLKPVRPLMSLQPRPRFESLQSYRPPLALVSVGGPSSEHQPEPSLAAEREPPPPGVDDAEFTSDVFDDIVQKFESKPKPISATDEQLDSHTEPSAVDTVPEGGIGAEGHELAQVVDKLIKISGTVGLLGNAPPRFEVECEDDDYEVSSSGYGEYFDSMDDSGENLDDIHPEFFGRLNPTFGRPCVQFRPEFEDFTEDTLISELLSASRHPEEMFAPPWEEDFQSNASYRSPVGFGPRVLRPMQHSSPLLSQPFRARGHLRSPLIARPPVMPRQRFPCNLPQRFSSPSDLPSPTRPPAVPWLRGQFRPRIRPLIRPFPRSS